MSLGTMEQRTEGMKRQAKELIEQAYNRGYKAGQESDKDIFISGILEQGRNEAWEAAKRILTMGSKKQNEIFGCFMDLTVMENVSASEAIEKLSAYDEEKKQEEDNVIRVGDEIQTLDGLIIGIVTYISEIEGFSILWGDGSVGKRKILSDYKKTGRHFPEIAEVLKKMQGGE